MSESNHIQLTEHEKTKIRKQIEGIQDTIKFLHWHREQLKQAIISQIPVQSARLKVQEKEIDLDWGDIPEEYVNAIKSCGLDRKIHQFYNVDFQMDLVISRGIGHYISDLYNTLNHTFNLVVFAHPYRATRRHLSDRIRSLITNKDVLSGHIPEILVNNKIWIDVFQDIRKIDEHKSPIDFHIAFKVRKGDSKVSFSLMNNYTKEETDLLDVFSYLEKIEMFFGDIKEEIGKML